MDMSKLTLCEQLALMEENHKLAIENLNTAKEIGGYELHILKDYQAKIDEYNKEVHSLMDRMQKNYEKKGYFCREEME